MTQTTDPVTPVLVTPAPESKLEQLHALYETTKADADAAAARLKTVTDAIKVELTSLHPEQPRLQLIGSAGPPLALSYTETKRFDSTRFRAVNPETYAAFIKVSGSWRLAPVKGGDE